MSKLPLAVKVRELKNSRYPAGKRPASWDSRSPGIDTVMADNGVEYKLLSDGQQSPPKAGWQIILRDGDDSTGYRWTLYGI